MLIFIFKFDMMQDQCQIKLGCIRLNYHLQKFLTKHAYFQGRRHWGCLGDLGTPRFANTLLSAPPGFVGLQH